jgi:hypothetical protein
MTNEIATKLVVDLSKPEGHPDRVQSIPLTAEELEQRELDRIAAEAAEAERQAEEQRIAALKASAKAKLVSGEALTEDEASVLVI